MDCELDQTRKIVDAELEHHADAGCLHCLGTDSKRIGHLLRSLAFGKQPRELQLTPAQQVLVHCRGARSTRDTVCPATPYNRRAGRLVLPVPKPAVVGPSSDRCQLSRNLSTSSEPRLGVPITQRAPAFPSACFADRHVSVDHRANGRRNAPAPRSRHSNHCRGL